MQGEKARKLESSVRLLSSLPTLFAFIIGMTGYLWYVCSCSLRLSPSTGALLGSVNGGVVEVTNSFGVQHARREKEVLIQISSVSDVIALHKRVNEKEVVVGWYSTAAPPEEGTVSDPIDDFTLVVHNFFNDFAPRPIHL